MKIREKEKKEEKNEVEVLLNHDRNRLLHRSSFFVLHPVSIYFKDLDIIYAPLGVGVLFIALHIFISFFYHQ